MAVAYSWTANQSPIVALFDVVGLTCKDSLKVIVFDCSGKHYVSSFAVFR